MMKQKLCIWIRCYGMDNNNKILPFLMQLEQAYKKYFILKFIICTNPNDPILQALISTKFYTNIIFANMDSFYEPLNLLINNTPKNHLTLTISLGVNLPLKNLLKAVKNLQYGAYCYGWQLKNFNNDGSKPGKGWYNTCTLLAPKFINCLKNHYIPNWVDNGALGNIQINNKLVEIGGNEEIPMTAIALKDNPQAYFILDTHAKLDSNVHTGTNINFKTKLKRKTKVSKLYLYKLDNLDRDQWQKSLIII